MIVRITNVYALWISFDNFKTKKVKKYPHTGESQISFNLFINTVSSLRVPLELRKQYDNPTFVVQQGAIVVRNKKKPLKT